MGFDTSFFFSIKYLLKKCRINELEGGFNLKIKYTTSNIQRAVTHKKMKDLFSISPMGRT